MTAVAPLHDDRRTARMPYAGGTGDVLADAIRAAVLDAMQLMPAPTPDPLPKGLYSLAEAAEWLSVSRSKVEEWVREGYLHVVRPPDDTSRRAIRREDLEAFRAQWRAAR